MPVIATAGHVDHGKSTLVMALTGRDPDRWDEEKRRGLTIDLGFAWTTLGDREVGFVDVPGHERFVKNMLAGVDGADAALFVVAADEGWKPQSEEHLAVLDLLGISQGVVALTRADLVDGDALELATLEVAERLEGTSLTGARIVPTAAPSGTGTDELRAALAGLIAETNDGDRGRPRLWIDRAFTIGGAGTIVTGTLVDGDLTVGDTLEIHPTGQAVRVRGLQVHERSVEVARPRNRTAVNLVGVDRLDPVRGMMLGRPGEWRPTKRIAVSLRPVRGAGTEPSRKGSHHLHIGSGAWPAEIRSLDSVDDRWIAIVELDEPVAVRAGDRVVVREVGRQAVVSGGQVLDPRPAPRTRAARHAHDRLPRDGATPDEAATALLAVRGMANATDLEVDSGGGQPEGAIRAGDLVVHPARHDELTALAVKAAQRHHDEHPYRPGIPVATLATGLGITPDDLTVIAPTFDGVESDGATVRLSAHRPIDAADSDPAWERARVRLENAGATPPRSAELGVAKEGLGALLASGALVDVGAGFAYLPETIEAIVARTKELPDGFTVAEFRDALGMTRKHAIPLLEWMDSRGITRRQGDGRVVRR